MARNRHRGGQCRVTTGLSSVRPALGLRALFGELNDLKRIRSADRVGSIASRGFVRAWAALVASEAPQAVMQSTVAAALAAARLGDLDFSKLVELGLDVEEARAVLQRALDDVAAPLEPELAARLRASLAVELTGEGDVPPFVAALVAQPRAGATCPGKPRLVLEPAESHAEHCWTVAVFGVLLAPRYGADPSRVFIAGLSHHLHNALLPDSGFTGEMLLGAQLEPMCAAATARALEELPKQLRAQVVASRTILANASTPGGRAFHAADVIDRVLQLAQHLRLTNLSMRALLDDWELVHAGPVKSFHESVLAEMDLA